MNCKAAIICFVLLFTGPVLASSGPQELIREASDNVLAGIKANPDTVRELVNKHVLPLVDFEAMTKLALRKHYNRATAAQKTAIVKEFSELLVRTYSSALLEYADEEIIYLPFVPSEKEKLAIVKTEIEQGGGFPIPINYKLRLKDDGWKVYDISVDEVSLVTNYRGSFARAIKKTGIDGLIKSLQERNAEQQ